MPELFSPESSPSELRQCHLTWKWHAGEELLQSSGTTQKQTALRKILLLRKIQGCSTTGRMDAIFKTFNMTRESGILKQCDQ
jgi:hypothetical protein